jgi:hypothetical protein
MFAHVHRLGFLSFCVGKQRRLIWSWSSGRPLAGARGGVSGQDAKQCKQTSLQVELFPAEESADELFDRLFPA